MTDILTVSTDLLFISRLREVARRLGSPFHVVSGAEAARQACSETPPRIVILDLSDPHLDVASLVSDLRNLPAPPRSVVAYGAHVREDRLRAARDAACDEVLTRGQFDRRMEQVLRKGLGRAQDATGGGK
jgi:CheY-like chemotaxis protein